MKVLIAEDDQMLQMVAGEFMELWGFQFDLVANGLEAVNKVKDHGDSYDLCLMDIDMPLMNGIEATKIIRRNLKYTPIIALSGNSAYRECCLECGMDYFLEKPYSPDLLLSKIYEFTVKSFVIYKHQNQIITQKVKPMDSEHLQELKKLREKGLTKLCIRGTGCEVVVDERVQNKISYDLIGKRQELSQFLDRSEDKPGLCHLYKSNFMLNTKYLLPDELEKYIEEEEKILEKCRSTVVRPLDE